ncbi:hypothetical protein PM10SUCC1_11170 [Propionigenium maris DSM 9537]|uniref:Uncharacterized protein n=1 Tax=Propionigenium maris DSM 9537 TaxID=1123000 RepID=A0A9W6GJW0_9FUSO|nr:hypothetical protein [Propionigenium maris]GLI55603.1 hypothetical protein PM10SUCC1_11170 [Propionigenium maris DSM 9537]
MKKLKNSLKKRLAFIKKKREHYFEYNKLYNDFLSYEAFRLKIDLESFILRNYNEKLQVTYLQDVIRDFSLDKKSKSNIITVDKKYRIIKNHERLIEAIKNNEADIEISVDLDGRYNSGVPIDTLPVEELKVLEDIMNKTRHIYTAIIWEPAYNFLEDIIKEIKDVYQVIKVLDIKFENTQGLIDYANKVYEHNTRKEFVQTKVQRLIKGQNRVLMIYYDIGDPKIDKEGTAQEQVQELKNHIRKTFRDRIDDYIFDICYHSGVNHKEIEDIEDALKEAVKNPKNTINELENFNNTHWKNIN